MKTQPIFAQDFYKTGHHLCYASGTIKVYSNLTPRKGRNGDTHTTLFGLQYFLKRYLIEEFGEWFKLAEDEAVGFYQECVEAGLGRSFDVEHLRKLHRLQYLPLKIKSLQEGSKIPYGIPVLTITNTLPEFYWLPNFLETVISNSIWYPSTAAKNAQKYKKLIQKYSEETSEDTWFSDFQLCDFSLRGHHSNDSGVVYGGAWATSFKGSDTFPAMPWLKHYYNADIKDCIFSVIATEHSIACSYGPEEEDEYVRNLIQDVVPTGIVSVVADTWSFPKFMTEFLVKHKEIILNRQGKVVIRPDSFWSNPQDCLCGFDGWHSKMESLNKEELRMVRMGAVEYLWEIFGGTVNNKGYKVLNPAIGIIYGEALFYERIEEICQRLKAKGFATTNFVGGYGSWGALSFNRDVDGWAMKATYCEILNSDGTITSREMFKDPITDDGVKKSARGLLRVDEVNGVLTLKDRCTHEEEGGGLLTTVFENGKLLKEVTLSEIRGRLEV